MKKLIIAIECHYNKIFSETFSMPLKSFFPDKIESSRTNNTPETSCLTLEHLTPIHFKKPVKSNILISHTKLHTIFISEMLTKVTNNQALVEVINNTQEITTLEIPQLSNIQKFIPDD